MDELLQKIKESTGAAAGASKADIKALEKSLAIKLPKDLVAIYSAYNGQVDRENLPFRLLSTTEAPQVNQVFSGDKVLPPDVRLFWTNDGDYYAGLFFDGVFKGNVCFFDSAERDFAPRYKTIKRFLEALVSAIGTGLEARDMPSDFGLTGNRDEGGILDTLRQQFRSATAHRSRRQLAFNVMALIPPNRAEELFPFLDDEDLWVQERAVETLGKYQHQEAIPLLIKVAERETTRIHNARIASIVALGRMKSAPALEGLFHLARVIPEPFYIYIYGALGEHGFKTKFEAGQWKYQHEGEWRSL